MADFKVFKVFFPLPPCSMHLGDTLATGKIPLVSNSIINLCKSVCCSTRAFSTVSRVCFRAFKADHPFIHCCSAISVLANGSKLAKKQLEE
jgi:hypothetical protein